EVLVVSGNESEVVVINVALEPINDDVSPVEYTEIRKLESSIEDRVISGALVSDATFIHGENLTEIDETRWAQISLVPSVSIGSNLSTNALINNHFSLNVLAGYSKGVRGVEIGSIANFVKEDVVGAQIGGVVNLNGGD